MTNHQVVYTYRAGEKIPLRKEADQFVIRSLPEEVKEKLGVTDVKQVSSSSTKVNVKATDLEPLMEEARKVAPTHHAYYVADTGSEFLPTDRILVTFRTTLSPEKVSEFAGRYGLIIKKAYSNQDYLFQLTDHTGMNPLKLIVKLTEQEPLVENADHDLNRRVMKYDLSLPTDSSYLQQWHLHGRFRHADFDPRSSSMCEDAWKLLNSFGSPEVVIGITDDGCRMNHKDFNSPNKFAGWGYFEGEQLIKKNDASAKIDNMYTKSNDHGTSCAGVAAAEVDAELTVGAAPGCRLLPIKWESEGPSLYISDSKLLTALDYISDKVDVLSNSWGGGPFNYWSIQVVNRITELSINGGRRKKGIIFLWAAGNENCPINHSAPLEVPYTNGWKFHAESGTYKWIGVKTSKHFRNNLVGIPGVMHIAALASTAQRSHYSNYGTGISITAPSNNIHEYYRISVKGLGITTDIGTDIVTTTPDFGGTSSATPLVAGIAALVISANSDLKGLEVITILNRTASKNLNMKGYPKTPPSASYDPNPTWDVSPVAPFEKGDFLDLNDPNGTWSPWFGFGKVDAKAAVTMALRLKGSEPTLDKSTPAISSHSEHFNNQTSYYIGQVHNGNFEHVHLQSSFGNERFTKISVVAGEMPRDFDFSSYEGKTIVVSGKPSSGWIFSTQVLGETNEAVAEAVKKLNGEY
ncbi:S8 family serine peptidase [Bacillus inaquosorum]|uniref:S8 family serine peptidase n=1 Tax=Bacillus inaquosorum TaxID=483913 RepID=UPI0022822612|nr:S8 family serine peptidase [Bacillus inaquosorum]MCY7951411.1 S8 family serine peptidase [Bacillus inaquosorum]MEC0608924.1 S8 family serine peptidase [Bacillus inaquosorum]